MNFKSIVLFIILIGSVLNLSGQKKRLISGVVIDENTEKKLPYASIGLKNFPIGTISNTKGEFEFYIPDDKFNDTLVVSYLGYKSYSAKLSLIENRITVKLLPRSVTMKEVTIYQLSPEDYLRRALEKIDINYSVSPYHTISYYSEILKENGKVITGKEAVIKSYHTGVNDTNHNQHQVLLFRRPSNTHKPEFMSDWIERQNAKSVVKNKKQGHDVQEVENPVELYLGGPEDVLSFDLTSEIPDFLDTMKFENYYYSFGPELKYGEKNMIAIKYSSKRKVDNVRESGYVFIDKNDFAILSIYTYYKVIIPLHIRSLLFTLGFEVRQPVMKQSVKYEHYQGIWYPKDMHLTFSARFVKRYLFKPTDNSGIKIDQVLFINEIRPEDILPLDMDKTFNPAGKMKDQVNNDENMDWFEINKLK